MGDISTHAKEEVEVVVIVWLAGSALADMIIVVFLVRYMACILRCSPLVRMLTEAAITSEENANQIPTNG